ncbi:GreA/GreB family elongation factor [Algoriphagus sp. D3-2-R+10]|uniref:GreA/GreB family elongation factor n=1 Tax=Algoriphagus aurantiacus TaxID=3103948 RepID=UPI002B3BB037|nr:GreA/GreB family elongation factor [Algoriphagus sp. D3-2-R+10]MEB2774606.1 GreA/GreB family elongation factor [Algoriphagus sp. D3-2-R+10]
MVSNAQKFSDLHKQKDVEAFYEQKGKSVPEEVSRWYLKGYKKIAQKKVKTKVPSTTPQTSLFEATTPLFSKVAELKISIGSKVTIRSSNAKEMKYIIQDHGEKGSFTSDGYKIILADSALAQAMLGKGEGDQFEFGEVRYKVIKIVTS